MEGLGEVAGEHRRRVVDRLDKLSELPFVDSPAVVGVVLSEQDLVAYTETHRGGDAKKRVGNGTSDILYIIRSFIINFFDISSILVLFNLFVCVSDLSIREPVCLCSRKKKEPGGATRTNRQKGTRCTVCRDKMFLQHAYRTEPG